MSNVVIRDAFGNDISEGDIVVFYIGSKHQKYQIYEGEVIEIRKMIKVKVTQLPVNQFQRNAHIAHNLNDEVWVQYYRTVVI